jgi:hypothetical protein
MNLNKKIKITKPVKGSVNDLDYIDNKEICVGSYSVLASDDETHKTVQAGSDSAIVIKKGDIDATWYSAIRTAEGNARACDYSVAMSYKGDVDGDNNCAVYTFVGDAIAGNYSIAKTDKGIIKIGDHSVGMGTKLGEMGKNSVAAITDENGYIVEVIIKKQINKDINLNVIEV